MAEDQNNTGEEEPKIIIDDDWKKEAQAEKEKLAEEFDKDEQDETAQKGEGPEGQPRQLPPASFTTLVSALATQAVMALGGYQDPKSGKVLVDLEMAKHNIDTLKVIEEKTKGNLDQQEKELLEEASYQVQMRFVEVTQYLAQQPAAAPVSADQTQAQPPADPQES